MEFCSRVFGGVLLLSLVAADIPVYDKGPIGGGFGGVGFGGAVISDVQGGLYRAPHVGGGVIHGGGGGGFGKGVGPFGSSNVYGLYPHEYVTGISSAYLVKSDLYLPGLSGDGIPHAPGVLHVGPGGGIGAAFGGHGGGVGISGSYGPPLGGFGGGFGGGHGGAIISGPVAIGGPVLGGFGVGPVGKGAIISGGPGFGHGVSVGPVGPIGGGLGVGHVGKGATIISGGPAFGHGVSVGPVGPIGGGFGAPGQVLIGGPTKGVGFGPITGAYGVPH